MCNSYFFILKLFSIIISTDNYKLFRLLIDIAATIDGKISIISYQL